nr:diguanylate cyclase [Pseudomarimonas arenosa]
MIVDDEPLNIQVLAEALGDDYDVRFTTRADEVTTLACRLPLDLILLDLVMPGRHGLEVLAELRAEAVCRDVPVIIVTAMNELDNEEAGLNAGAVDYITKPISPAIVRARVRTHVELKRQRDQLAQLAEIDGLTGIANRRRFDRELQLRWHAAQRHGDTLCLMLGDVDHFKQYNDHFGHGPGDQCLKHVAAALAQGAARTDDLVARYGGEEFAVISRAEDSAAQAQRMLSAIAELQLPHPLSSAGPYVSLSLGVLDVRPRPELSIDAALAAVDTLLYQAKRQGRRQAMLRHYDHDAITPLRAGG